MNKFLRYLFGLRNLKAPRNQAIRIAREITSGIYPLFYSIIKEYFLVSGHVEHAILSALPKVKAIDCWYRAKAYYLRADYDLAIDQLKRIEKKSPEVHYLWARCLEFKNNLREARKIIINDAEILTKTKSWLILANMVNTTNDFSEYQRLYKKYCQNQDKAFRHFILAACRSKNYDVAIKECLSIINDRANLTRTIVDTRTKRKIDPEDGFEALQDLINVFSKYKINLFVISGTLLGFYRDKNLIGYDSDLDVGIFDLNNRELAINIIKRHDKFDLMPVRTEKCIRVRHLNGVPIDIFFHWNDANQFWHGGVKVNWHNDPFELELDNWKSLKFYRPRNIEHYLTENYGNWKVRVRDFDSAFDTPNLQITNKKELIVYILLKIVECKNADITKYKRQLALLNYEL